MRRTGTSWSPGHELAALLSTLSDRELMERAAELIDAESDQTNRVLRVLAAELRSRSRLKKDAR